MKISSIIIAKNEENNIGRCINSQLDCIDEIIVLVDKSSTDKTLSIVKSYSNVTCVEVEWMGYAKTKQHGISLTNNDWIFWIDADEEVTDSLKNELIEFKNNGSELSALTVARRAWFLGKWIKHSGWYPGRVTRLFNKQKAKFNDNSVHENLVVQGKTGQLKYDLEHYTDPDIFHYYDKFNRYTTLAAIEMQGRNKSVKLIDILFRPLWLFIKMYIFRLGFLDGVHGLILAIFSSNYVFTKYCKLWELNNSETEKATK